MSSRHDVCGLSVEIINTRPDIDTGQVLDRLAQALDLLATQVPYRFRRLRHDLNGIVVRRFPCRGAFFPQTRECLVELTFVVNPRHSIAEVAASILHEATHARIARRCGTLPLEHRPREERLCRKAELEFGLTLSDGAVVVERARAALALADHEVAPTVDWAQAAERVAAVDRRIQGGHN